MGKQLVKIVKEICKEEKINFTSYSEDYVLQLEANKKIMYIFGNRFPNNNAAVEQICNDKSALSCVLDYFEIPHVAHFYFDSPVFFDNCSHNGNWNKIQTLLKKYGTIVCKNNRGTGGNNVYKVTNQKELEVATLKIFKVSNSMCVSPYYDIESEYRVVIVGNEFQYAFKKIRSCVVGDGKHTIFELCISLPNKNNIISNSTVDWDYIPANCEKVEIEWRHNLGQGASPVLVDDEPTKAKLISLAKHCASALNLGFVSIDIIESDGNLRVLEINSGVMIENFSKCSAFYYQLAKNAVSKAIKSYLDLDKKYYLTRPRRSHFVLPVLTKIAKKKNVKILEDREEKNFAIFMFPNGKNFVAKDYPFNVNQGGSISLCSNKNASSSFIKALGYQVPKEKYFVKKSNVSVSLKEIERHLDCIEEMLGFNFPVVVKPNNLSQGEGVNIAYNREECMLYAQEAFGKSKIILLQEYCVGNEYRVVVLKGKILQAYQRKAFCIIGDGVKSVAELITDKVNYFKQYGRDKEVDVNDPRVLLHIIKSGYTMDSILEKDKPLKLQDIANLSLGGESVDVIDKMDKKFEELAINLANDFNLMLCGIDIIASDISNYDLGYHIIEINSSPGLDNYLYPKSKQNKYVESLYSMIFDELSI